MTGPNLPQKIDRAALERIIQRAAELQTGEHAMGEALSPEEVLALGNEVGIPQRYLQQAMLEEQTRLPTLAATGALDRAVGPAEAVAQRVVTGDVETVQQRLVEWMEQEEILAVQRERPGQVTWEPMRGFQAAMRRSAAALGGGSRPHMLARAGLVSATVTPLEPGYVHVALRATAAATRSAYVGGGLALASAGVVATTVLLVLNAFWLVALAPIPAALVGGGATVRAYRPVIERLQLGLERALDCLERGEIKPAHRLGTGRATLAGLIATEIRKALKP